MRILVLHSPYLSGPASGENRVVEDEVRLLRSGGHEVEAFLPERATRGSLSAIREGVEAVWSRTAVAEVQRIVRRFEPEIVHCHNLFPALSPAVLRVPGRAAVVMTLHNYRLLCLPAVFLRDGKPCEDCLAKIPWRGVLHRCYRSSGPASAALATSVTVHRVAGSFDRVDLFLAVSDLVRSKHLEGGLTPGRIAVRSNFAWETPRREGPGDYFLFAGRLSREKDLGTVLEAWRSVETRLVVAGDGPDRVALERIAPPHVEFLGTVEPRRVHELLMHARALVLPSVSYEGSPRSVVEAFAAGVPVIANAVGAVPEFVTQDESGRLVPPRDPTALVAAANSLADDTDSIRLGERAWAAWHERYRPEQSLLELESAYRWALANRTGSGGKDAEGAGSSVGTKRL